MKIAIIIPTYNEENFIAQTLESLVTQQKQPQQIIVVDDNSTDATAQIIKRFSSDYKYIKYLKKDSEQIHLPGGKVVQAFNFGLQELSTPYDILCKFDGDLVFPPEYLARLSAIFQEDSKVGMAGGFCHILKDGEWILENLTNKDHIRGALKAYRRSCFEQINGLKPAMGWDTLDELLAQYHGWSIKTVESLAVKHLKPTGTTYAAKARLKQGEAFYGMRYGLPLTLIASGKLALRKKDIAYFKNCLSGYFSAKRNKKPFLVNEKEGQFIRQLRWKMIQKKLFLA
ncbi:glycosyltransferase family 2 protein [Flavimarina sp. Hel_I_48]|uniref:glycosyltransferase family 2 protein n=1 Tax=Flavimarina sp. Hel_I_48 TaxID=1392488 RepID=UPI0004DF9034|nr:glycosyltransferase family 2 protein [Flavimarina sp. Hel_I_48]